jgi:hypothetical protein
VSGLAVGIIGAAVEKAVADVCTYWEHQWDLRCLICCGVVRASGPLVRAFHLVCEARSASKSGPESVEVLSAGRRGCSPRGAGSVEDGRLTGLKRAKMFA